MTRKDKQLQTVKDGLTWSMNSYVLLGTERDHSLSLELAACHVRTLAATAVF